MCFSGTLRSCLSTYRRLRFKRAVVGPTTLTCEGSSGHAVCVATFSSDWTHKYLINARKLAMLVKIQRTAQPARTPEGQAANKREMHFFFCARALFLAHLLGC